MGSTRHLADTDPEVIAWLRDRYDEMARSWQDAADAVGVPNWMFDQMCFHAEQHIRLLEEMQRKIAADPTGTVSATTHGLLQIMAAEFQDHPQFRSEWIEDEDAPGNAACA